MKRSIVIIFGLALFGAMPAHSSTTYTIAFTATVGPTPTSGSFTYDSTLTTFTAFQVVWAGTTTFDLKALANNPTITGTPPCIGGSTGAAATFLVMTACANGQWDYVTESIGPGAFDFFDYGTGGNYSIATDPNCSNNCLANQAGNYVATATPEPGTSALMLIGLGWLMRKRIAHGFRQATRTRRSRPRMQSSPLPRIRLRSRRLSPSQQRGTAPLSSS